MPVYFLFKFGADLEHSKSRTKELGVSPNFFNWPIGILAAMK